MLTSSLRQFLLFAHLIAFAFAFVAVVRGDITLLSARRHDPAWQVAIGRPVRWLLCALWLTGIALVWLEYGLDPAAIAARPKMLAKITVVALLSANGLLLHVYAFPRLGRLARHPRRVATICTALGAVSSATWLYAAFVGQARFVGPLLTYAAFMGLYAAFVGAALAVALTFVRPRIERLLAANAEAETSIAAAEPPHVEAMGQAAS